MKILFSPNLNCSFGYRKITTANNIINQITEPIRNATKSERKALVKALGFDSVTSKNCQTQFESHKGDIIGGMILPNISVTSKGISPMAAMGNVINIELARIKGQLKRIPIENFNL